MQLIKECSRMYMVDVDCRGCKRLLLKRCRKEMIRELKGEVVQNPN